MNAVRTIVLLFIVASIFFFGWITANLLTQVAKARPAPRIASTATVLKQVQTLSELVTIKYIFEKVVVLEDVKWYPGGDNKVLLVAHGVVKAGPDLSQLQSADLVASEKKIRIKLPRSVITDCYLDDKRTRILERSTGLLRTFDKDLEQSARQQAVSEIMQAARENGIEKEAETRARAQLTNLLHQLGFSQVEFQTK